MSQLPDYLPEAVLRFNDLALDALPGPGDDSLESAHRYCSHLARRHYENFIVVSPFLPTTLRRHFYHVYAYCRWSDDLADETGDTGLSLELLDWWDAELQACYDNEFRHPVFIALRETIDRFEIPIAPFRDLLTAFRQDQVVTRYRTYADVLEYCRYSANPVGRLVLYLCGYRDRERQLLSDATCTALQLANFWQDVRVDLEKGRIYMPLEDLDRYQYTEEDLEAGVVDERFRGLMSYQVNRTRKLFDEGLGLCGMVDARVGLDIELFNRCGSALLDQIERRRFDVLSRRPTLSSARKAGLFLKYALKRLWIR
ncbi:MAG: squalene synthase HpnC [Gemmatimonadetes bacterium]|nr:squalene synthase HpnC [Gemmatimonadota bacterium]MYD26722.1 squalene synthase HpnC [Gemmatimonadota bacterium]MYI99228.1 squalene synthase HpnC [Gemmatimonadota bacterium]